MTCTLCDLPTPDPPYTDEGVDGEFCCRGCLEVARTLDDPRTAELTAREARDTLGGATARGVEAGSTGYRGTEGSTTSGDQDDASGSAGDPPESSETAYLSVQGMHCTTCEAFLETTALDREGVYEAEASYPSEAVKVTYDPEELDRDALAELVEGLGYTARDPDRSHPGEATVSASRTDAAGRLLVGGFFAMMIMLWYVLFLYPAYLGVDPSLLLVDLSGVAGTYVLANTWVMATIVLVYTGFPILRGAYVSLRARRPNMDLLIALAATTAYVYSAVAFLSGRTELYFDVSVVIVMAVSLGDYYRTRIRRRAADTLAAVTEHRVDEARRKTAAGTETVAVDDLEAGDRVVVRPGERIPVDGEILDGRAAVDESLVTGESVPVERGPGDEAVGGALATDGALVVEVGEGATSTVDRLLEFLWEVRSTRPGAQKLADRIAAVFVPVVIVLAAVAVVGHLVVGTAPTAALLTGLAVLVVSCPCALGLATPLAVAAGVRAALDRGIVITDGSVFETATDADVIALDKTGTLTAGEMAVVDVVTVGALDHDGTPDPDHDGTPEQGDGNDGNRCRELVLERAAAVETYSQHPIGTAIVERAGSIQAEAADFERHPGRGVSGDVDGDRVVVGRRDLIADRDWTVPDSLDDRYDRATAAGEVPAMVAWDGRARGVIVATDRPRDGWREVVADLSDAREVVVITGDRGVAADRFREHPGIDRVFAGVAPEAKARVVERLRAEGTVAMVGDGSNDAPALAAADLGIAMESGTRMAADAADAVVTTDDLTAVPAVFEVTAAANRRIKENLAWAFLYNALAVPAAALGVITPLVAAVAMAASSLLVVANSARGLGGAANDSGDGRDDPTSTDAGSDADADPDGIDSAAAAD